MRRQFQRLSAREVMNARRPGYYPDGAGLYLQVSASGAKSWLLCYKLAGKAREMGLGSCQVFSLAEAPMKAGDARKLLAARTDPIDARHETSTRAAIAAAKTDTFNTCAAAYIEAHRPSWKNIKHAAQWTNTLATYCSPTIGHLSMPEIDTGL